MTLLIESLEPVTDKATIDHHARRTLVAALSDEEGLTFHNQLELEQELIKVEHDIKQAYERSLGGVALNSEI